MKVRFSGGYDSVERSYSLSATPLALFSACATVQGRQFEHLLYFEQQISSPATGMQIYMFSQ
jgi:hypothetical protein